MEKENQLIQGKNIEKQLSFNSEEKKLLKKYIEEYNDMYQKILLLSKDEFVDKLEKHIELSLRSKIKNYSEQSKSKVKEFIVDKVYESDYKYAQIIKNSIEKRNRYELSKNCFKGEIIPHCDKDKKNGFYIHSCGEKFQTYKYKISYDYYIMHLDKESKEKDINTNHYESILYCKKCNMIYKSSLIKFRCAETATDFYSKISIANSNTNNSGEVESDLPYATWAKYHCNVVINDLMKCHKCSSNLFFLKKKIKNSEKKLIFCKKCNKIWLPEQLRWECLICKNKFSCDIKAYNPLEFKTLKICVKDALVEKIRAFPKSLDCKCKIDYSKNKFIHKTSCHGELFIGELNGRKTVICNKCDSIGFYDEYIWTCPLCFKKTKKVVRENKFEEDKISEKNNHENKSALHRKINNEIKVDKKKDKDKDNISVSKISNESTYQRRRFFNFFKNDKINKNEELNNNNNINNNDLKNSISSNNYIRYKNKNNNSIYKESENNSIERKEIKDEKNSKTKEKDESSNNNSVNKEYNNDNSTNPKEEYFRNFKKKFVTNVSIKSFNKEKDNNLPRLISEKKDDKNNKETTDTNNNIENKILKTKKSLSIIDFGYSNIKDLENILTKFEKKININLSLKPSIGINYHRPSSKQINNQIYSTAIEKKDKEKEKEIKVTKNRTTIEESPIIKDNENENKIKRKESFISKYNKFKKSARMSRVPSNKNALNENKNTQNILTESSVNNNKNDLFKSANLQNYYTEINQNSNKNSSNKKEEYASFFKKSKIFQRYKNLKNINNNINKENKNIKKINNEFINNKNSNKIIHNDNNNCGKDLNDNYISKDYDNKKGSNSTAADSEQTTKIIYHNKNPRQSLQIRKANNLNQNSKSFNFNINDFKIIKKIGQGSFGQIFQIEDKHKNNFAMKKIILTSENDIKKIENEYQILMDLNNQKEFLNLVKIYGYSSKQLDPTTYVIYVLMELAVTDWEKEILLRQKTKKYYTEKELMSILYTLINTFAELQKRKISHRDIKPQNILLFKDKGYKLADFGEAKELYGGMPDTNKQTLRGTELYMAPTLFQALQSKKLIKYINHNPYKSDVFSFGLCSLLAGSLCFESIYDIREMNNNVSIHVILEKYLSKNYSFDVINVISQMLDINETTRKDFIEMKKEFESIGYN